MPLVPNFTIGSILGLPSAILLTDTSTGSDAAIASRNVFLITNNQVYLVPSGTTTNYTVWAIVNATSQISALDKDYALQVTVNWVNSSGVTLYTKTILTNFNNYNSAFEYSLVFDESSGLASLNSANWLSSRMALRLAIDDSNNAITLGGNIAIAQSADDRGTWLRKNKNTFY